MNSSHQSLTCPISYDWLVDPIIPPCCGQAISRQPLVEWFSRAKTCPVCRTDISNFNPHTAPSSKNIIDMVLEAQQQNVVLPIPELKENHNPNQEWIAKVSRICNNNGNQSTIGKLTLTNKNNQTNFKTLFIPTVDKSGSMSGSAFNQVKYSLNRITDLTYRNPQLITNLVSYCDRASTVEINTVLPQSHYDGIVNQLNAGGGTSFYSAFEEIVKICGKYKDDPLVSSIIILFLTDGEDSSARGDARSQLIKTFKANIESVWKKPYTVHTIGFTGDHDDKFLNELRLTGQEGAYRYADPREDNDCISSKINSILDVIAVATSIPIKLLPLETSPPIIINESGKYWLNLTKHNMSNPLQFQISINDEEPIIITAEFDEEDNDPIVCEQWYSILIDQIASELIMISSQVGNALDKQLHCEILQRRIIAIRTRLDLTSPNYLRLEKLVESLTVLQSGGVVDQRKLNDAKFEGQFQTKTTGTSQPVTLPSQNSNYSSYAPRYISRYCPWTTINAPPVKRCNASDTSSAIFVVIGTNNTTDACNWIDNNYHNYYDAVDSNGSNPLIVAASIGRVNVIRTIIDNSSFKNNTINNTNNFGYNAIDMAALFGYWISFDILAEHGAIPTIDGDTLLRTCLSKKYYNVSDRLIKNKFSYVSEDLENSAPNGDIARWLNSKSQKDIPVEIAIIKGMYDEVYNKLDNITTLSLKPFIDLFSKPIGDHIKIINLLLTNNKIDVNEQIDILDNNEKEITWPLFVACEKGSLNMVKLLLKYCSNINQQNLRGTSCLWIACCNKHIDIVLELLQAGANPNLSNFKGDSPLIPACQKGSDSIVELLLESGADMNAYNKNRDNPILICCRTGQYKILEMLLKRLSESERKTILETFAEIDGFVPLLASTELDKVECIKVCVKYGANLEERTQLDNQIISGATAVHLASFYGRTKSLITLQSLGANMISQTLTHGFTPLHISIKQGHKDATRYLLNTEQGKLCLQIRDNENRLPIYYANKEGNELIMEEFFTNKLETLLNSVIFSDEQMEQSCANILVKYGQSLGCYEYNEITNIACSNGSNLLSNTLLTGKKYLIDGLMNMNYDLNMKDDYGITPSFWQAYLGYDVSNIKLSDETCALLDKVNNISKKNMQNKMLLNVTPQLPSSVNEQLLLTNSNNNLLNKMKDGYLLKVHNNVLSTLKKSKDENHSIIGFVEKLKNNKVFPQGKQYLEYIIWNAKIHLIKMIASGETNLDMIHMLALYLYSSNQTIFENVNMSIAKYSENNLWNPFVCCLYQAIDMLPVYENEVYRGIDIMFNVEDFAIDRILSWNTFAICSKEFAGPSELINLKKGIVFIIHSKTGKDISKYSRNPVDSEVIFNPGTLMKVTNYYVASMICLGQANIRKSTYSVKENDLMKAIRGESCIIVELDEVI
jgi:ankyrin repeat protein